MSHYIYTYAYREEEQDLCELEMRAMFGTETKTYLLESPRAVDPSRSPFIKSRLEVFYETQQLADMFEKVAGLQPEKSFKVKLIQHEEFGGQEKIEFAERRRIEKKLGLSMLGEPELDDPEEVYGLMPIENQRWCFGLYTKNEPFWLYHNKKPQSYSTALSTRVARSVVNIAAADSDPAAIRMIDPCCGIGTVMIEALSMGIDIRGCDNNPLIAEGARKNIAHFGYDAVVETGDMRELPVPEHRYDVAILDLPYNIFNSITPQLRQEMLTKVRQLADRLVVISIESIAADIEHAGFQMLDYGIARKAGFKRQIHVCQ